MEITVEVGDSQQKEHIKQELSISYEVIKNFDPPLNVNQVIVASDFDAKINELHGVDTYKSIRGIDDLSVVAVAKIIEDTNGIIIVLSPLLFTEEYDIQTRYFIYIHEIAHIFVKQRIPNYECESPSFSTYYSNIHTLFDEYLADRTAFEIVGEIFTEVSNYLTKFIFSNFTNFLSLITDTKYYNIIKREIGLFRLHGDVMKFLDSIRESFDVVARSIIHAYAIFDQYPEIADRSDLLKSRFVNGKTLALVNFFKDKYERGGFDLYNGLSLVIEFMTNFRMKFEDMPQGCYCHVLDI